MSSRAGVRRCTNPFSASRSEREPSGGTLDANLRDLFPRGPDPSGSGPVLPQRSSGAVERIPRRNRYPCDRILTAGSITPVFSEVAGSMFLCLTGDASRRPIFGTETG